QANLTGVPQASDVYFLTFTLGTAGTTASAGIERNEPPPAEAGGIGGVEAPSAPAPTPSVEAPVAPEASFVAPSVAPTTRRTPATAVKGNRSVLGRLEADLLGALISHRMEVLYLAFTIAFIGLCLSSRLLVPRPRRPAS